jgi:hypothetical protein
MNKGDRVTREGIPGTITRIRYNKWYGQREYLVTFDPPEKWYGLPAVWSFDYDLKPYSAL